MCAAVVSPEPPAAESLRKWLAERIAPYKVPRRWLFVDELPRNAMGKVTKPAVKELFVSERTAARAGSYDEGLTG